MSLSAEELRPDIPLAALAEDKATALLEQLAKIIAYHDSRYHAADERIEPEISDAEYDALVRLNTEMEAAFPTLVRRDSPMQCQCFRLAMPLMTQICLISRHVYAAS